MVRSNNRVKIFDYNEWKNKDDKTKEKLKKNKLIMNITTFRELDGSIEIKIRIIDANDGLTGKVFIRDDGGAYYIREQENGVYIKDYEITYEYIERVNIKDVEKRINEIIKKVSETRNKVRNVKFKKINKIVLV